MKFFSYLLSLFLFASCDPESKTLLHPEWEAHFKAAGVKGTVLMYEESRERLHVYHPERADSAFLPASTYKIPNTLIALETGSISGVDETIAWDSVERFVAAWNQDLQLPEALRYSAVWFYQELARRIGEPRMQKWIDTLQYGNQQIGGGIDLFWLQGDLRISAHEQIDFLRRLYHSQLPVKPEHLQLLKEMLMVEEGNAYTLHGKTGWAMRPDRQIGWWVGWVERQQGPVFFALNIDIKQDEDRKARKSIVKSILQEMAFLSP